MGCAAREYEQERIHRKLAKGTRNLPAGAPDFDHHIGAHQDDLYTGLGDPGTIKRPVIMGEPFGDSSRYYCGYQLKLDNAQKEKYSS